MLATLNALFSLFLSYGVLLMANGLFSTLLGVRSRLEGFDPQVTGLWALAAGLLGGAFDRCARGEQGWPYSMFRRRGIGDVDYRFAACDMG